MRIVVFLPLFALCVVAAMPAQAAQNKEDRFTFLMRFFDLNESAFAFHRHCVSRERLPDRVFMDNLDYVANELMREMSSRFPASRPDKLRANIMERRYAIQEKFNGYYYSNDCESDGALAAQAHYQQFRAIDSVAVQRFILEKTGS